MSNHDTFRHIAPQLLRFAQSFNQFRFELKNIIKDSINRIESHKIKIDELIKTSSFLNIDEILDFILHPSKLPAVIVVIDNASEELSESLDLINLNTNIITFKTFKDSKNEIHLFEPFNEEIRDLKLNAEFVVLSACNTAAGDGNSNEGLSGLASAFIFAGARSIMASHWSVESHTTQLLITNFFRNLKKFEGISRSQAMRQSMKELFLEKQYQHPIFWAPFVLVGQS